MSTNRGREEGFTLIELTMTLFVLAVVSLSILTLFVALVNSELLNKRKAVASTLATNQMEYLKSLPYNSLAVAGGSIPAASPLPNTSTTVIDGASYTTKTSINYIDDAFDGCAAYPTPELKAKYCRNLPAPSGAPAVDTNDADYKIVHVSVFGPTNIKYAEVDTQISARVAETASTTGALFVTVIDDNGNPVSGATVTVTNNTLVPIVNVSDSTDSNGNAIFYSLVPDTTAYDYVVTASNTGYSTLTTIVPAGSLQPNYSSQRIFTQQSSLVTMTIKPQGANSLVLETTDTAGNPISGVKPNLKGGYKKYSSASDTSYYYDTMTPTDTRPTTDASGLIGLSNLVPGNYFFCGDGGATSCTKGGTTYYLAAAVPYLGSFSPVKVPTYVASSPPATTFTYNSLNYLQKVRLMLTTSSTFPRVQTLTPSEASIAGGSLASLAFQVTGVNLPCNAVAASCNTSVRLTQGASIFIASCTGTSAGLLLNCTVNLSGASAGQTQLVVTANSQTLTLPGSPMFGGINVTP